MVTINNARKILQRVDTLPLYLHAYAFHLNMRLERVLPADLLNIASENNLRGVKIHVLDGERFSLGNMDDKELSAFGDKARRLNLDIHIETSASDKKSIDEAVAIALKTGASSVRFPNSCVATASPFISRLFQYVAFNPVLPSCDN